MLILMLLLDVSRRLSALPNPTAGCQSVTWIAQQFDAAVRTCCHI
jgi:hypothetical protein